MIIPIRVYYYWKCGDGSGFQKPGFDFRVLDVALNNGLKVFSSFFGQIFDDFSKWSALRNFEK